jgi:hypothetical protein
MGGGPGQPPGGSAGPGAPAVGVLRAGLDRGLAELTGPDGTAALIGQLRIGGTVRTCDPGRRPLRADGRDTLSFTIGKDR